LQFRNRGSVYFMEKIYIEPYIQLDFRVGLAF